MPWILRRSISCSSIAGWSSAESAKLLTIVALLGTAVLSPFSASAQTSEPSRSERVVTAQGQPVAPWVEKRYCATEASVCEPMIVNPETGEIAKLGSRLGSRFELTGNGQELRRAETAMDKAIRLKAGQ